jgi:eukaryotic-like serine/threonine-protein kinase
MSGSPAPDSARFVIADGGPSRYPQSFGPYVLLSRLARGGMGDVCLAKLVGVAGIERMCVVKSIRSNLLGDDAYVRRFIEEAKTVIQLAHRNICSVLDVGAVDAQYYLAMELIAGRDLRTLQERARLQAVTIPHALVLHIVGDMLDALDYAHRLVDARTGELLGIVHRDVSPQNVMVSFEGEVKLIDFGLAISKNKLERTEPGIVLGKLQYMSPEQARGDRVDLRTDVFAAGVLLYELLAGERYYEGLSLDEVWQRVGGGTHKPRALGQLPTELRDIVLRAVAPEPAVRFQSCGELRAAIHEHQVRRHQVGSASELRALMTSIFSGEEAADRRARAALGALPLPPPPHEDSRAVRFAVVPTLAEDSTAVVAALSASVIEEAEAPTLEASRPLVRVPRATEPASDSRPTADGPPATALPRASSRASVRVGLGAVVAVCVVVGIALTQRWQERATPASADMAAEAPSGPSPVAPVAPTPPIAPAHVDGLAAVAVATAAIVPPAPVPPAPLPPAPLPPAPLPPAPLPLAPLATPPVVPESAPLGAAPAQAPARDEVHSAPRGEPLRREKARPRPRPPPPAAPLPEPPATTTGRVRFLAEHCRATACAAPLLAAQSRWKLMSHEEAQAHVAAVKDCVQRCSGR